MQYFFLFQVDCFSFGMFIYELVALRIPFDDGENGIEAIKLKGHVLSGGRPPISSKVSQNNLDISI